jgi:drug/metabolite transporter (DMT)-like permease
MAMILSDNMRGALLMTAAMTAFVVNDAFMKTLSDALPLFQAILLRGIGSSLFLFLLTLYMRQLRFGASGRDWTLMVIRALSEMAGSWFFLTALFHMPFADLAAIMQSLPLTVTLVGALFLGEAVGWRRIVAIFIGFLGVLLIIKPGPDTFTIDALYGLATVACVTVRDIVSRMMSPALPSLMVATVSAFGVTVFAGIGAVFVDWQPVTGQSAFYLTGAMVFLIFGYLCSVAAVRVGDLGFVAPFRYTGLVVALVVGVVVFGTFPDAITLLGASIVVATGLFTLYREQIRRKDVTSGS